MELKEAFDTIDATLGMCMPYVRYKLKAINQRPIFLLLRESDAKIRIKMNSCTQERTKIQISFFGVNTCWIFQDTKRAL